MSYIFASTFFELNNYLLKLNQSFELTVYLL